MRSELVWTIVWNNELAHWFINTSSLAIVWKNEIGTSLKYDQSTRRAKKNEIGQWQMEGDLVSSLNQYASLN